MGGWVTGWLWVAAEGAGGREIVRERYSPKTLEAI